MYVCVVPSYAYFVCLVDIAGRLVSGVYFYDSSCECNVV